MAKVTFFLMAFIVKAISSQILQQCPCNTCSPCRQQMLPENLIQAIPQQYLSQSYVNTPQAIINQQLLNQVGYISDYPNTQIINTVPEYSPEMCKNLADTVQAVVLNRLIENSRRRPVYNQLAGPLLNDLNLKTQGCPLCGGQLPGSRINLIPNNNCGNYGLPVVGRQNMQFYIQ